MDIKTKFSPGDTAYFFKSVSEINIVKIKSIETKSLVRENKVLYFSEEDKEYSSDSLLTARELTNKINGY